MLIQADARALPIAENTVQCVVTSPPYFGLRDYGTAQWVGGDLDCDHQRPNARQPTERHASTLQGGVATISAQDAGVNAEQTCSRCGAERKDSQIGLERSPAEYVATLVQVFREVRRVLKDEGTVWLNLGSSYGARGGDTHSGFNERYFGKQFATDKQSQTPFPSGSSDDKRPSRSHADAPAYGSDGKAPRDLMAAGSFCSDLCDGCLADWLSHRERIAGNGPRIEQYTPPLSPIAHDTERTDSASMSRAASLLDVPVSTTLESWRRHRAACSHCDNRASALSSMRSSSADVQAFAHTTWLDYTSKLKQKDLIPIPWMVAMALQADGWYLRSDIIWHKPNPMPESVTDRPTKAHEYLFLLAKQERYYYDAQAIMEPSVYPDDNRKARQSESDYHDQMGEHGQIRAVINPKGARTYPERNRRSVWTIPTMPYAGAHFATMPEKLVEPCILAGCQVGGLVLDPFIGSGTVGAVAERLGRRWVGTDLTYHELSTERTAQRGLRW